MLMADVSGCDKCRQI